MMKKLTLGFFISAMVLFTGCSQKDVNVSEENTTKAQPTSENKTESSSVSSSVESSSTNTSAEKKVVVAPELKKIYFDFDKYVIRNDMRSVLKANSTEIIDSGYKGDITLEGHCDERGSNEYNFALGLKRAQSVKSELVEYGVNPSQIKIISYGENEPLCTEKTESCWAKNRRVELIKK